MRYKVFVPLLAVALIAGASIVARAQDEDEAVRGSFLTSRPKASSGSGNTASLTVAATASQTAGSTGSGNSSSRSNRPKSSTGRASGSVRVSGNTSAGNASGSIKGNTTVNTNAAGNSYVPNAIGLGYTLYMRDSGGNAVRVDPAQEFHAGDRIRLSLETNTDGYLYIFHTENDNNPEMLYPDVHLEKGSNRVEAHVPYEIPWNEPGVENWFKFDANPANERLCSTAVDDGCGGRVCLIFRLEFFKHFLLGRSQLASCVLAQKSGFAQARRRKDDRVDFRAGLFIKLNPTFFARRKDKINVGFGLIRFRVIS